MMKKDLKSKLLERFKLLEQERDKEREQVKELFINGDRQFIIDAKIDRAIRLSEKVICVRQFLFGVGIDTNAEYKKKGNKR